MSVSESQCLLRRYFDVSEETNIDHEELFTPSVIQAAQSKSVRVHNSLLKLQLQTPLCQEVRRPDSEWSLPIDTQDQYRQSTGSDGHGIPEAAH